MSNKVFEIVARIMGVSPEAVTASSSPQTLENWDSLRHMKLILAIEESLDVQFNDEEIVKIRSVQDLLNSVDAKR